MADYSTTEISKNWELWNQYVNPSGAMTRQEFDDLTIQERNLIQRECFPDECPDIDAEGNEIADYEEDGYAN
jgi:hypothetical protein